MLLLEHTNPLPCHALAVEASGNRKTGPCHATYAHRGSCGNCILKKNGCYGDAHPLYIHWDRISTGNPSPEAIARDEANAIDTLTGRSDARIHVVGDCQNPAAASIIGAAVDRLTGRQQMWKALDGIKRRNWTYSHSWRDIPRKAWGDTLSVLASCHYHEEGREALAAGYAPALTVESLPDKPYRRNGVLWIPCAEQASGVPCVRCRACFNLNLPEKGLGILFELHAHKRKARQAIARHAETLNGTGRFPSWSPDRLPAFWSKSQSPPLHLIGGVPL